MKEYYYCPRVIYFERVLGIRITTEHLERGRELHNIIWAKKKKHFVRGDTEEIYQSGVELFDKELGLIGKIDFIKIIKYRGKIIEAMPIEIKLGSKKILERHHKMQLVAYALLIRRVLGYPVRKVAVYYPDTKTYIEEEIREEEIEEAIKAIDKIREIIRKGEIPEPTEIEEKCQACQYFNFCMGI